MTETNQSKQEMFEEYFFVDHAININVIPVADDFEIPNIEDLADEMPETFKLAAQVKTLEANALRPLRNLSDTSEDLVEFLKAQSKKIDLIMCHIMAMQDSDSVRRNTTSYGGGGFTFVSDEQFNVGQRFRLKLFFSEEATAIYCYGEVLGVNEQTSTYSIVFTLIREDDREVIVRATLHEQSKQLKRKAQQKKLAQ